MANTIAKAIAYLKSPEALAQVFNSASYTADLVKPNKAIGTDTIKYQKITYGSNIPGVFSRVTGYPSRDITQEWIERKLTQDWGDSLYIDKMDDEESLANGIVTLANGYTRKVLVPHVDKYRFAQFVEGAGEKPTPKALTKSDIADTIIDAIQTLVENEVDTSSLVLYVNPVLDGYLKKDAYSKGYVIEGNWNGNMDVKVRMFDTAKIVVVPSSILGDNVNFILLHTEAAYPFVKYQEAEYFDKIPGFGGRRAQVDIGIYHDAWLEPGTEKAVLVHTKPAN